MDKKLNIPTIHLVGDSIVQSYENDEFIGGWGQYLACFLNEKLVCVKNHAIGGRSSRSFLNEERFQDVKKELKKGDYLFIEFCHNDDDTKGYETIYDRQTPLGNPDKTGRFPIIKGELIPTNLIPKEYFIGMSKKLHYIDQETLDTAYEAIGKYGDFYYPYSKNGVMGSYKWFLLQYVEAARSAGAIPVLVTAPPRATFEDEASKILDGPGLHGGNNFAYIRAMRQLSKEQNVILIDIFTEFRKIYESIGRSYTPYLTSIKSGVLTGEWPIDFEISLNTRYTVSEATHLNKFGAYLLAGKIIDCILDLSKKSSRSDMIKPINDAILERPTEIVAYPRPLEAKISTILSHYKYKLM